MKTTLYYYWLRADGEIPERRLETVHHAVGDPSL